jgi:SCP-2 sterol transfer family
VAVFLSDEWFAGVNVSLSGAGPVPLDGLDPVRVVLEFTDSPKALPHALTFTLARAAASVEPGDHLGADAVLRLSFADARALVEGTLSSADALRDGRVKLRGDLDAVVALVEWLKKAHPRAEG